SSLGFGFVPRARLVCGDMRQLSVAGRDRDQTGHPAFAERALRNIWPDRVRHSGLMLAARITFAHFSVSSAMNLPKSAGVIDFGTLPMPANCVINLGSARAASIASWSLSLIVAAGAVA